MLAQYAQTGSEAAFRALVARYINLVYSTALRLVEGDRPLAEDVTQTVFINLAKMSKTLSREVLLGGWLHQHTFHVASTAARSERRRRAREREASEMNVLQSNPDASLSEAAPFLDEAIMQLGSEDRTAILLRFFEQRDFRSVGEALGSSEDAARMRVNRALDKLHGQLKQRGVTMSAAALGTALTAEGVAAAPAGLAASTTAAALSAATVTTTTVVGTTQAIMATTKLKTATVGALLITSVVAPLLVQSRAQARLRQQNEELRQRGSDQIALENENRRLSNLLAQAEIGQPSSADQLGEILRLRGEATRLRTQLEQRMGQGNPQSLSREDALASKEKLWGDRVTQLKQWLSAHPSEMIPELRLLSDRDRVRVLYDATDYAQHLFNYDHQQLERDEDYRIAASMLRNAAEQKFADALELALRRYSQANDRQFPTDLLQLKPYLEPSPDEDAFQRWQIVPASDLISELQRAGDRVITQKAPINETLDVRIAVGLNGTAGAGRSGASNCWSIPH